MKEENQYFYHPDHLGSSSYITNILGEVSQHEEYSAFGEPFIDEHIGSYESPYLFNAKEKDSETGLYYYGARYYDPKASVWVSVDPLTDKYPELSPYNYCKNNPVIYNDPDGKDLRSFASGALDFVPFVGSVKQIYEGVKEGNRGKAALGVVMLGVDVFTFGEGGEAIRVAEKGGQLIAKEGAEILAKNEVKSVAEKGGQMLTEKVATEQTEKEIGKDVGEKSYQTYTKTNEATGEVYSGRTSGKGTPYENVASRDKNHHMNEKGFGPAKLDKSSTNKNAIRGREQQLIDKHGGAKSTGGKSGNAINGIGAKNKNADIYLEAAKKEF